MKYYAVIDTNVVVSAFLKNNSVPDTVLDLALTGIIIPLLNDDIVKEYREVLSREKFGLDKTIVDDFISEISSRAIFVNAESIDIALPDVKDKVFFEIVMEKRKSSDAYLVTGNIKHFPIEPFIVTPREMLELIVKDSEE